MIALGKIYVERSWVINIGIGGNAIIGTFVGMCSSAVDGMALATLFSTLGLKTD